MTKNPWPVAFITHPGFQVVFSTLSLLLVVVLTAAAFVYHPFDGLVLDVIDYPVRVVDLLKDGPSERAGIRIGDAVLSIDGHEIIPWGNSPIYRPNIAPGEKVVFEILRENRVLAIPVEMGNLWKNASGAFLNAALMLLLLGSWGIGSILSIFAPEGNTTSRLIGFHWQLMAVSLAAAVFGRAGYFWGANTAFLVSWALLTFTNVIVHSYFPEPVFTPRFRKILVFALFVLSLGLAFFNILVDWFMFPQSWAEGRQAYLNFVPVGRTSSILVFLSFLISFILGAAIFVRSHFRYRKTDPGLSRQTRIVIWGMIFGTLPLLIFSLLPAIIFGDVFLSPEDGFLFFILIPLAYGYALYQRKLLQVDFIINRALVLFLMILIVLGIASFAFVLLTTVFEIPDASLPIVGGAVALFTAFPMPGIRHRMEVLVNRILYGEHYDFETVTADLSDRLSQVVDRANLTQLLADHLPRIMGIQQSALYLSDSGVMTLQGNGAPGTLLNEDQLCAFLLQEGKPLRAEQLMEGPESPPATHDFYSWGKIFVPLIFEKVLHGFMIFGDRLNGTVYSKQDIEILQTVSHQAALAVANVSLVEKMRGLTQQLVRVDETQRKQVARDLHDAVLPNLFFVKQRLLQTKQQELTEMLDAAISQLRMTIKNQRSSLLDQGLTLALQGLIADMQRQAQGNEPIFTWYTDFDEGELRAGDEVATSVYRIVQEALTNILKHAQASKVSVKLEKSEDGAVVVIVEDDGVGMTELDRNKAGHFGLIGMRERAVMINADLHISSHPGAGTTVILKRHHPERFLGETPGG